MLGVLTLTGRSRGGSRIILLCGAWSTTQQYNASAAGVSMR